MRKISAHYVIPVNRPPLKHGIVIVNDEGLIVDIHDNPDQKEFSGVEFFNGVIVPGFVNAHCHLELSHLKGKTTKGGSITNFISDLKRLREEQDVEKQKAIQKADLEMFKNGIVAVGDIINTKDTSEIKKKSSIQYHNFMELFGLDESGNNKKIENALQLAKLFNENSTLTPHSFYSVNINLFDTIQKLCYTNEWPLTVHNQESLEEMLLFESESGDLFDFLIKGKNGKAFWEKDQKKNFSEMALFSNIKNKVLMVHNTYSGLKDIDRMNKNIGKLFWVFCPKSNLYIEKKLPDINLFRKKQQVIAIGTDSLASNDSLNILEEMKVIQENFPDIPFIEILQWATLNGAKAIGMENKFGSIETGKQPGLNLINKFDFVNFAPAKESFINNLSLLTRT